MLKESIEDFYRNHLNNIVGKRIIFSGARKIREKRNERTVVFGYVKEAFLHGNGGAVLDVWEHGIVFAVQEIVPGSRTGYGKTVLVDSSRFSDGLLVCEKRKGWAEFKFLIKDGVYDLRIEDQKELMRKYYDNIGNKVEKAAMQLSATESFLRKYCWGKWCQYITTEKDGTCTMHTLQATSIWPNFNTSKIWYDLYITGFDLDSYETKHELHLDANNNLAIVCLDQHYSFGFDKTGFWIAKSVEGLAEALIK